MAWSDEELVARSIGGEFSLNDFGQSVAKFVRAGHVQTDEHWLSRPIVVNGLAAASQ